MQLKSQRSFPPGGFRFTEPKTGWQSALGRTFDETVDDIISHRLANPRYASQWATEWGDVARELDAYTCKRIKYDPQYCRDDAESKKATRLQTIAPVGGGQGGVAGASKKIMAGIGVLIDWLGSSAKVVPQALAENRAEICASCPQNGPGDLTRLFTVPASKLIMSQLEIKEDMKLSTSHDGELNICMACLCPLKLKVHAPISHVRDHLSEQVIEALDPRCWITKE